MSTLVGKTLSVHTKMSTLVRKTEHIRIEDRRTNHMVNNTSHLFLEKCFLHIQVVTFISRTNTLCYACSGVSHIFYIS